MNKFGNVLTVLLLFAFVCAPIIVLGQETSASAPEAAATATTAPEAATPAATAVVDLTPLYGIGAGLVLIGAALGIARIGATSVEGMARQPEVAGKIQTAMIISAALIEGVTFFALIVCMLK